MKKNVSLRILAALASALLFVSCRNEQHTAYALTADGQILQFQTGKIDTKVNAIINTAAISGLDSGERLVQIAYRPASASFYGVTSNDWICTVNPVSGAVAHVGATPFTALALGNVAAAFDPVNDQLRIIATSAASASGFENLRVDPVSGSLLNATTNLAYSDDTAGSPQIDGILYIDSVAGSGSTTLYGLDVASQKLVQIGSTLTSSVTDGDAGKIQTIGAPGVNFGASLGFSDAPSDGFIYAALASPGSGAALYAISLETGGATALGAIGASSYSIISLAIAQ